MLGKLPYLTSAPLAALSLEHAARQKPGAQAAALLVGRAGQPAAANMVRSQNGLHVAAALQHHHGVVQPSQVRCCMA